MASLREALRWEADVIRDGIGWVAVWKVGRGWKAMTMWMTPDDMLEPEAIEEAKDILQQDQNAVLVNGYECGHMGDMTNINEIAAGVRWYYERQAGLLRDNVAIQSQAPSGAGKGE